MIIDKPTEAPNPPASPGVRLEALLQTGADVTNNEIDRVMAA